MGLIYNNFQTLLQHDGDDSHTRNARRGDDARARGSRSARRGGDARARGNRNFRARARGSRSARRGGDARARGSRSARRGRDDARDGDFQDFS